MGMIRNLINKHKKVKYIDFDNFYENLKSNIKIAISDVEMMERDMKTFKKYPQSKDYIEHFDGVIDKIYDDILSATNSKNLAISIASVFEYTIWYLFMYEIGGEEYRNEELEMNKLMYRFSKLFDLTVYSTIKYVGLDNDEPIYYEDGKFLCQKESKYMAEIEFLIKLMQDLTATQTAIAEEKIQDVRDMFRNFSDGTYCIKHLKGVDIFEL